MSPRRQLPVHSPIRASSLASALRSALTLESSVHARVAEELRRTFGAREVVLTDSGTSALVLALRALAGDGRTVALPAYSCVDLAAAAVYARVRVRLYDLDPGTLSPDLDSVSQVLARGVDAIVVAHLYGFPANVPGVAELAAEHGVPVIEDAAQSAGGTLHGKRLGSFGPVTVLSFGRGKGITGGRGGALLLAEDASASVPAWPVHGVRRGWRDFSLALATWVLGRPSLYGIPSAIPGLRLGEMVYHPAHEPGDLSIAAAALIRDALTTADRELAVRRGNAESLSAALVSSEERDRLAIRAIAGATPGYLRFPIRAARSREPVPALGILRGYPRTLAEEEELRPWLHVAEVVPAGAAELSRTLLTLPVHGLVTAHDLARLGAWLRAAASDRTPTAALARA